MLQQAWSQAATSNPDLQSHARKSGEGNLAWLARALRDMTGGKSAGTRDWAYVVLVGGADTLSFRLRVAQSHLRPDMLPSYWSEVLLLDVGKVDLSDARALHVPLAQPEGPQYAPNNNGVLSRPVSDFDDVALYPNIGLIALPTAQASLLARLEDFKRSRATLDALEHVLRWLAYAWGVARTGNPLHENYGIPSACMLEIVCSAVGFDLTPGLESRASCPEAIWGMAQYWHGYFERTQADKRVPYGRYTTPHGYPIVEAPRTGAVPTAKAVKPRKGK